MKELLSKGIPELAAQWSAKNELTPDKYTLGSGKKVWWVGSCGHEWQAIIKNRVKGSGCPYCSGNKLLRGYNDLASKNPDLAAEWSDRNLPLLPDMFMCKSNIEVWWKGSCGHEWKARIADRYEGHGCPYCAGKIMAGYNDLATTRPAIMDEWCDRNEIDPAVISEYSRQAVWWRCRDCGYEWRARINTRCNGGADCPACRKEISRQNYDDMLERRIKARRDRRELMRNTVLYYIEKTGISYIENYDPDIGIPISIMLPDMKIAVEFSTLRDNRIKEEVKNVICRRKGFTMVRILEPGVKKYDTCYCIQWKEKTQESLKHVLRMASYILGIRLNEMNNNDL